MPNDNIHFTHDISSGLLLLILLFIQSLDEIE
jgi:hypothetical protein